jgi:hypothetical protein
MGGREYSFSGDYIHKILLSGFCRPCVDAGKAFTEIPQVHDSGIYPSRSTIHTQPDANITEKVQQPLAVPAPILAAPSVLSAETSQPPPTNLGKE